MFYHLQVSASAVYAATLQEEQSLWEQAATESELSALNDLQSRLRAEYTEQQEQALTAQKEAHEAMANAMLAGENETWQQLAVRIEIVITLS